jgi:hypothetical protein
MTHTQLIDTILESVPLANGDRTKLKYTEQMTPLTTGTIALSCYQKTSSALGLHRPDATKTPLVALPTWNTLARMNSLPLNGTGVAEDKYETDFAGSVRDNQKSSWANPQGKYLQCVSTHVGGMVGGEVSDAIVRTASIVPIIVGSELYHVQFYVPVGIERVKLSAILVDNGYAELKVPLDLADAAAVVPELGRRIARLTFNSRTGCADYPGGYNDESLPVFLRNLGELFCFAVQFYFRRPGDDDTGTISQIGRIGRAAWATSAEPADPVQIALSHFFRDNTDHKGTIDVLYCDA